MLVSFLNKVSQHNAVISRSKNKCARKRQIVCMEDSVYKIQCKIQKKNRKKIMNENKKSCKWKELRKTNHKEKQ